MVNKLTKEQGIILTGFTGKLCCKFSDFHEDIEKRLGRPVLNIEFASEAIWDEIKEVYKKDFLEMMPDD